VRIQHQPQESTPGANWSDKKNWRSKGHVISFAITNTRSMCFIAR
jgi:hypothetical protein